jgi:tetratricopeptide (TPR) repeat protein
MPADVEAEIRRLGGRRAEYYLARFMEARDEYAAGRDRAALRILRPLRDVLPDAPSVRELTGLAEYSIGNYRAAAKELEAFVELTDSAEDHHVLMDCYRAQKRWKRVDELWAELGASSPSAELVTEGRIVLAGSLADRGRLAEAIELLRRKAKPVAHPREHHLRLWYALADLEERAGNLAAARELFARVRRHDPELADVAVRSASLR